MIREKYLELLGSVPDGLSDAECTSAVVAQLEHTIKVLQGSVRRAGEEQVRLLHDLRFYKPAMDPTDYDRRQFDDDQDEIHWLRENCKRLALIAGRRARKANANRPCWLTDPR